MTRHGWILTLCIVGILSPSRCTAHSFNERPPNATDQQPAFAEQTRAPILDAGVVLHHQVIAAGLNNPWGMDMLPDGG